MAVDFDEDYIWEGGKRLAKNVATGTPDYLTGPPGTVTQPIPDAAAAFGAKRIHIVAHSKGGLWSRAFLDIRVGLTPTRVPLVVLSLTTIDTPHLGSFNADLLAVDTREAAAAVRMTAAERAVGRFAPRPPGGPDLTTAGTTAFVGSNHLPPTTSAYGGFTYPVRYYLVSADANLDSSCVGPSRPCSASNLPTISYTPTDFANTYHTAVAGDESEGYEYPDPDNKPLVNAGQFLYQSVFQFKSATVRPCTSGGGMCLVHIDADGVQLNDFNVTLNSARLLTNGAQPLGYNFSEIASLKHNHTMVGQADTAALVLANIRSNVEALLR